MSDLIERLRPRYITVSGMQQPTRPSPLELEAADEIERLRAELAARDWQPIETYVYPGKGHRVIVFAHVKSWINNKEVTSARVGEAEFEGYAPGEWAWANASCECCYGSMQGHPTHWMPLPKEPKS